MNTLAIFWDLGKLGLPVWTKSNDIPKPFGQSCQHEATKQTKKDHFEEAQSMCKTQTEPGNKGPTLLSNTGPIASEFGALEWELKGHQSPLKSVTPPELHCIAMK